jgi:hypothetical protein
MTRTKKSDAVSEVVQEDRPVGVIFGCKQEVADALRMSIYQFEKLLRRYPFDVTGVSGKILGRWHVTQADVFVWYRHVQRQESRHPEARRMRPEEAPDLDQIKGRS